MTSSEVSRLTAEHSVVLVGAGQHARSLLGVLAHIGSRVVGLIADRVAPGDTVDGARLLGGLDQVPQIHARYSGVNWLMAIGDNYHRLRIMREIQAACPSAVFSPLVHPSCVIAQDVVLEEGAVVMPGAVLMAACRLGPCSLVNTRGSLDHESTLAEGASLAPGVVTGGRVHIGRRSFVGIGAAIAQGICVGADSVVGAGSLVLQDVADNTLVYGRPAKFVRNRQPDERYF